MPKLFLTIAIGTLMVSAMRLSPAHAPVRASSPAALRGVVTSHEEGRMEGVVVSARREGANFTVSVVSDAEGKYSFPRTHLESGKYALTIRAVGYDLLGPGQVEITNGRTATADLKLGKTKDLASQMSSMEWAM